MTTLSSLYDQLNSMRTNAAYGINTESERIQNEKEQDLVIEQIEMWFINHPKEVPFSDHPYFSNENFTTVLLQNPKFSIWQSPANSESSTSQFRLTDAQQFAKTYIHPNSPYNSLLLWHGTGVGKTCTAVGIAEQFKKGVSKRGKKIWIICPKSLFNTWYSEIFNVYKALQNTGTSSQQCTGDNYTSLFEILQKNTSDLPKLEREIKSYIDKFYSIITYDRFVNVVTR